MDSSSAMPRSSLSEGTALPGTASRARTAPFWLIVVALLWPAQLVNASSVITAVTQAQVAIAFHTSQISWFMVIYVLIGTLLLPFAVKLSDMYGKRRVMMTLIAAGLVGDVICALAPSYGALIAGRAIAACYVPVAALALAAARDVIPVRRLPAVIGTIGAALGAIVALGPLLAGWLLDSFGFRGALWFVAACTIISLVLTVTVLPDTPRYAQRRGFDWIGGTLLGIGILAVMAGVGDASGVGWSSPKVLVPLIGGIIVLLAFVVVERRVSSPVLNLAMLSRRKVATVLSVTSLLQGTAFAAAATMTVVIPLYPRIPGVSDGLGWSALHGAVVGLPAGVVLFGMGLLVALGARRINLRLTWLIAVVVATAGLVGEAFFHYDATQIIITGIVAALGTGVIFGCTPILVLESVSTEEQAQASGMSLMLVGLMATLGAQFLFTTLNSYSTVAHGTAFYHDAGYRSAYLVLAAIFVLGLVISFAMPRSKRRTEDGAPTSS